MVMLRVRSTGGPWAVDGGGLVWNEDAVAERRFIDLSNYREECCRRIHNSIDRCRKGSSIRYDGGEVMS